MNTSITGRKLFIAFSILGCLNIALAYSFFYYSSVSLLEERSSEQMASVRALASQKLNLYLENVKINAVQDSAQMLKDNPKHDEMKYSHLKPLSFTPVGEDHFLLKVPVGDKSVVWDFSYDDLNKILSDYSGLGKTGEIYLVGMDQKIKSASRHVADWKNITVNNESIRLGKLYSHGVHFVKDYRGKEVISAYSLFKYDGLNFILLSEIDKEEVFLPLKSLFPKIFLICIVLCCLTIFLAFISSDKILRLIQDMRVQINKLHIQFINAMEDENKKISYNLHDGVGQILTALKWGIDRNEEPEKLKQLCDDAFKEIRNVSGDLMPTDLSELGFFPAVRNFMRKQEAFFKIKIHFWNTERLEQYHFQPGVDVNLYRMIQELLQNTLKHAKAESISLVMFRENANLVLRYEDDGVGMPEGTPLPKVLTYRAELMGATLVRPQAMKGIVFQLQIPLSRVFSERV